MSTDALVRVFDGLEALSAAAASAFAESAKSAEKKRGRFSVALAGGNTPRAMYRRLASEHRGSIPWKSVHLFWSDERFVPPEHPDSNVRMVRETLLDHVTVPGENVHRPDTALDPDESARRYESVVRSFFGDEAPRFDWMLLGVGPDGHVASLFPLASALEESARLVVAVRDSPKPPPVRLTMTLPLINASREVHVLAAGREKSEALRGTAGELPVHRVRPAGGSLRFWLDRAAAGG